MLVELKPANQKSFYGKALVEINDNSMTLYSYNTPIMTETPGGFCRHFDGWTQTTGKHIKAFCGMCKSEFERLPLVPFTA